MARPANRKEWLETFLRLVDNNMAAREYRTKLGLKLSNLSGELKNIGKYREELEELYKHENDKESVEPTTEKEEDSKPVKTKPGFFFNRGSKITKPQEDSSGN